MTDQAAIGFIGLGRLGAVMAGNLLDRGHTVRVHNRTASKADPLVARGAQRASTAADAITPGGIVITSLWDGDSVESVVKSDGFLDRLGANGIHIAMSTIEPAIAKRLAALHTARGSTYLDAPVFGRPEAAAARQLLVPLAGAAAAKTRARPILEDLGANKIFDLGESVGAAVLAKLIGNYMIGAAARTMTEALAIGTASGGDAHAIAELLTTTLFAAPIYQTYAKRLLSGAPPMQGGIIQKDVGILLDIARETGAPAPLAAALYEQIKE